MKRNTIFGAAALLVAGAAIGAGSVVSQNAMAATGEPAATSELTMVTFDDEGNAIECTFEGADVEGLIPTGFPLDGQAVGAPIEGTPIEGQVVEGGMVVGFGEITAADGSLPELQLPEGVVPTELDETSGVVSVSASVDGSEIMVNAEPIEARKGTAEECAAMHDQAIVMASNVPTEVGGQGAMGGTGVIVSGSAVVENTKP